MMPRLPVNKPITNFMTVKKTAASTEENATAFFSLSYARLLAKCSPAMELGLTLA
jgi:hypothetical protein